MKTFSSTGGRRVEGSRREGSKFRSEDSEAKFGTLGKDYCVHPIREEEFRGIGGVLRHRGESNFVEGVSE